VVTVRRRDIIAGVGALGVFGAGAATALTGVDLPGTGGGESSNADDGRDGIRTFELPRFDAPGSPPGREPVTERGRVSFVTFFATWCSICQRKMEPLGAAYDSVDEDVQFVSVTNEPVGKTVNPEEVVEWWRDHDGRWPVAHDADLELTRVVDAPGVPYSMVFDADNVMTWSAGGYKTADQIRQHIDDAK
jgi:thiol-disulfide isomerase/thioredoxin